MKKNYLYLIISLILLIPITYFVIKHTQDKPSFEINLNTSIFNINGQKISNELIKNFNNIPANNILMGQNDAMPFRMNLGKDGKILDLFCEMVLKDKSHILTVYKAYGNSKSINVKKYELKNKIKYSDVSYPNFFISLGNIKWEKLLNLFSPADKYSIEIRNSQDIYYAENKFINSKDFVLSNSVYFLDTNGNIKKIAQGESLIFKTSTVKCYVTPMNKVSKNPYSGTLESILFIEVSNN